VGSAFAGAKVEDAADAAKEKLGDKATGAGRDLEGAGVLLLEELEHAKAQGVEIHAESEFKHWATAIVKLKVSEVDGAGSSIIDKAEDLPAVGTKAPEAPIEGAKGAESTPEAPSSLPKAAIPKVEAMEVAPEATEVPTEEEQIALVSRLDGGIEGSWQSGEHDDGLARAKLAVFVPPAEEHVSEPPPSVDKGLVKNGTDGPEVILALDHVGEGDQAQGPAATKPMVTEDLKEIAGGATEASTGSVGHEKAGVEEGSRAAEAADGGADAKGTGVDASNGTTASGNDSSVGREPKAAVAAEAGGGDEQGEAIAKETTKEVVDNLGDWSGVVEADARGEPEAEIIFPQ
jgi:hypothetical protein